MKSGLVVIHPGLFTTVQDQGRTGFRRFGVPLGGVFDRGSADLANALLGNPAREAVLELTLVGGTYEAVGSLALALAGAPMAATIRKADGREMPVALPVSFSLDSGDRLTLGSTTTGARAYLAARLGWQMPIDQESRSSEIPVKPGSLIPCHPGWTPVRRLGQEINPFATAEKGPLRVIDGPDAGLMDAAWFEDDRVYRVGARSDRMGLRLEGPAWDVETTADRVSAPVAPGAVQVAGGRLIVLGVACGTIGGYPHVAHLISADLERLAQARPGDSVRFERVTLDEAPAARSGRPAATSREAGLGRDGVRD